MDNRALWMKKRGGPFEVGAAPYTPPDAKQIVVKVRAVGLNIVDGIPGVAYLAVMPWVRTPTVIGADAAGEVVEVGPRVTRFKVGDRVLGHALGLERAFASAAAGAFQHYVVLQDHMASPIPDDMPFEQAAVLPLQLSTAACGMFQQDGLRLTLPCGNPVDTGETVLVWGGSTGVGSNAIQLARNAGYRVVSTSSPHNFDYLRSLGATATIDRHSSRAVDEVIAAIGSSPLAGSLAIGAGSLSRVMKIAARATGTKRVSSYLPDLPTRFLSLGAPKGVKVTGIWGGSLAQNEVGPAIYEGFLPDALARGAYQAAPAAEVAGQGLAEIPAAIDRLRKGVSAKKLVALI